MTEEERYNLLHPEKECEYCHGKFRAKRGKDRWCCPECRKKDNARVQREKRAKEKEEAEEFKNRGRKKSKPKISFEEMGKLMKKARSKLRKACVVD